jgi:lipopolysaccharide transport system ATP-binding protein
MTIQKPMIRVEGLGKRYRRGQAGSGGYRALRDVLTDAWYARADRSHPPHREETFWALRDINFEVGKGEVVGIIGHNGAGKSTLLKILSRVTVPTEGRVILEGRVGALLEVGTGFHPELTGRENIYLSGAILGMRRDEIRRRFDAIVDFAAIGDFLDTPVKRYSSGMRVRLGFSVAAHLEPEILLVDEVLAVGDMAFRDRCLGKMSDVAGEGRTLLVVSHHLALITDLCTRALVLDHGSVSFDGPVEDAIHAYRQGLEGHTHGARQPAMRGMLASLAELLELTLNEQSAEGGLVLVSDLELPLEFKMRFRIKHPMALRMNMGVFHQGLRICTLQDTLEPESCAGEVTSYFSFKPGFFRPGIYSVGCGGIKGGENSDWFWADDVLHFEIPPVWTQRMPYVDHGVVRADGRGWRDLKVD